MREKKTGVVFLLALLIMIYNGCDSGKDPVYEAKNSEMEHYIIVSDLHLDSSQALNVDLDDITQGENTFYLGDIYEVIWARPADVNDIAGKVKQLREQTGDRYIRGNHEGAGMNMFPVNEDKTVSVECGDDEIALKELDYAIRQVNMMNVLFVHGHKGIDPDYNPEKIRDTEVSMGVKGILFRSAVPVGAWFKEMRSTVPSAEEIDNAVRLAVAMDCQTIVFGHTHVRELFDQTYSEKVTGREVRVINVPRGVTYLEL